MRAVQTNKSIDPELISGVGLTEQQIGDMYRLLAIAKYDDRFVIPSSHRESWIRAFQSGISALHSSSG